MIKVSVLYPNRPGAKFDMTYYCEKHIPMVQQKLGAACKQVAVEHGTAGMAPGSPPAFIAMGHLYCDSVAAFQTAFAPQCAGNHGRHSQLHRHRTDNSDQRSEDLNPHRGRPMEKRYGRLFYQQRIGPDAHFG